MFSVKQDTYNVENNVARIDVHGFLINPDYWAVGFAEITLGLNSGELSVRQLRVIHYYPLQVPKS